MRPLAALLAALAVASCANTGAATGTTASSQARASATAPVASATSSCRLPMWIFDWSLSPPQGTAYFLELASGHLIPAKPPTTSGDSYATYVAASDRWLPVPPQLVAPDGKHYASNDSSGNPEVDRINVVDVGTGADRVIVQGTVDSAYEALAFQADGIYAGRPSQGPGARPGLWRLDPVSGRATLIEANHRWSWISHGYAYTVVSSSTDPVLAQGGPVPDTLLRLDLSNHTVSQWFRKRGVFINVRGFDWSGRPVVLLGASAADLGVVTGQDALQPLIGGSQAVTFSYVSPSLAADADGFWFGADQGVLRYSAQGGFKQVWQNSKVQTVLPLVAGPCA